eukprot:2461482-Rhodomonas_salina.7
MSGLQGQYQPTRCPVDIAYYVHTSRCPVLAYSMRGMSLRACCAMPSTDLASNCYLPTRVLQTSTMSDTVIAYDYYQHARSARCPILTWRMATISLRAYYAVYGTDMAYEPTRRSAPSPALGSSKPVSGIHTVHQRDGYEPRPNCYAMPGGVATSKVLVGTRAAELLLVHGLVPAWARATSCPVLTWRLCCCQDAVNARYDCGRAYAKHRYPPTQVCYLLLLLATVIFYCNLLLISATAIAVGNSHSHYLQLLLLLSLPSGTCLREHYAISGTDAAYGATSAQNTDPTWTRLGSAEDLAAGVPPFMAATC